MVRGHFPHLCSSMLALGQQAFSQGEMPMNPNPPKKRTHIAQLFFLALLLSCVSAPPPAASAPAQPAVSGRWEAAHGGPGEDRYIRLDRVTPGDLPTGMLVGLKPPEGRWYYFQDRIDKSYWRGAATPRNPAHPNQPFFYGLWQRWREQIGQKMNP